ncbi:hypothetical protein VCRA2114E365_40089 [Vibrio crassostreae]|jgi:hypothetical protein|uniref:Uncharacterized protein n=1 Tax=Vibrio crassostreae TaxID=246167 RepID=A0ABM9QR48_9VIBR|nr:hypothetical protein VCRA2119O381_1230006 [Vibrio crassostreae]CAK1802534.1 hypothetical protein VCRA2111O320_170086 [Vibrio crassostreae]CAK1822049.1 hypothetical protein VCRA2117O379_180029 [Vibrio crassostreae]CAK1823552.1 hypothetical protein VCRA2117O380_180031 [Vibrio crassostreae]CAK1824540.1 hypothetical protein VCRA2113O324_180086 [Vibrio crassostreae]
MWLNLKITKSMDEVSYFIFSGQVDNNAQNLKKGTDNVIRTTWN